MELVQHRQHQPVHLGVFLRKLVSALSPEPFHKAVYTVVKPHALHKGEKRRRLVPGGGCVYECGVEIIYSGYYEAPDFFGYLLIKGLFEACAAYAAAQGVVFEQIDVSSLYAREAGAEHVHYIVEIVSSVYALQCG